ncbi:hypothetical protein H4R33_003555 [Dimargaris cristalligena]|uniref:SH3 domain-containing protein n=1 Tax=Dimargaris cristalligena TaxID=215637 RepID=A0A4P9ZRM6_9FUNG|nr:hypothetical protein H4R33_003555 [Dimargaris cristalligena]RKP36174.1 hypothetical protein BJ085DRAFT_35641 [Dimargaris cristalligena]|eukprot:RKP36174.1 hypothetical protein BJ085DRAFT_35641 [Dimargaris cristalligena]
MGPLVTTLFALLAATVARGAADPSCYSLKNSKYCGTAFGQFQISQFVRAGSNSASNVEQFDRMIDSYVGSAGDITQINQQFGCRGWNGTNTPRYRITNLCHSLLSQVASQQCNPDTSLPPLCGSTCTQFVEGWQSLVSDETLCPNQGLTQSIYQDMLTSCTISETNTNQAGLQCVSGEDNEPNLCGFLPIQGAAVACKYCKDPANSASACCQTTFATTNCPTDDLSIIDATDGSTVPPNPDTSGSHRNRILAIVLPIVLGTLALLVLLAVLLLYRRRRARQTMVKQLLPTATRRNQRMFSGKVGRASPTVTYKHLSTDPLRCRVIHPFVPRMEDEIALLPGQSLLLFKTFDDGWAVAYNLDTEQEGTVPLVCVTANASDPPPVIVEPPTVSESSTSDTFNPAEIERSLMSLNASAAAIDATVRAASVPRPSIGSRSSHAVLESQLPRRSASKRPASGRPVSLISNRTSQTSNYLSEPKFSVSG